MIPTTHLRVFPHSTGLGLAIRQRSLGSTSHLPVAFQRHGTASLQHHHQQRRSKSDDAPTTTTLTNPSPSSLVDADAGASPGAPGSNGPGEKGLRPGKGETLRQEMLKRAQQKALLEEEMKLVKKQMELIKKRKELDGELKRIDKKLNATAAKMEGGQKRGLKKERGAVGMKREVPALPLGHHLLVDEADADVEDTGVEAALEAEPLTTHRLTLVPQPSDTNLLSPAPPPGSLLIFACSSRPYRSGISVLEAHYPRAYKLYKKYCMSIPASISSSTTQTDLHHPQGQDQNQVQDQDPVHQARIIALDKHQRSLVGTALLIRPPPSFLSSPSEDKNKKATNPKPLIGETDQERTKKHFIGLLFISKESSTSVYRDPPVAILGNIRKAMADLMSKVGKHNRRMYLNDVAHKEAGAPEVPEDKVVEPGVGGWGKTGVVGRIEEMRMAKDDISKKKWGVKWEMTREILEGLEVKVPGGEASLPGGGEVKVFGRFGGGETTRPVREKRPEGERGVKRGTDEAKAGMRRLKLTPKEM